MSVTRAPERWIGKALNLVYWVFTVFPCVGNLSRPLVPSMGTSMSTSTPYLLQVL
ncbi:hypothetical protein BU24DRAFT_428835 [Aaosphaeria arxii CBS 175.79]|uniref:Uncharacterized protein n=1 Tax=Aaosphaeria arxii CBS 175.79 TaxID=1450172 RepID=A0A6A5X8M7_9PLEO|nr:uncharacterized protein BU24DRAFT_428835 [Aaosphaeria arxii CBS 175.79]KAF2009293.1 hypothetical protein BU24DRAFT_428835 [Aaosphaeria arxii CBS 175.79]